MSAEEQTNIDPALRHMKEFAAVSRGTTGQIQKMRQRAILQDGNVPSKFKILGAVLWSVSARCEPCIKFYAAQARKAGVTVEELGEFLAVACAMGGCVGEMWALKAFHAYRDADGASGDEPSCCKE